MAYADCYQVVCPYCEKPIELDFDFSEGDVQSFEMDCPICCRPVDVDVRHTRTGIEAEARREVE